MLLNYTNHDRERMQNRKVTEFEIEQTVLNPDNWHYDEDDPQKYHAIKYWAHRTIEVVYISMIDAIKIILKLKWFSGSKAMTLAKVSNLRKGYNPKTISFLAYYRIRTLNNRYIV